MINIKTNNQYRFIDYGCEIPEQYKNFDYYTRDQFDCAAFVRYKDQYYDLSEFTKTPEYMSGWDGVSCDSFFSGVLIKLDPYDCERVLMGRYYG